jgi:nucleoside-diphosphate-sugar epimerase
MKILITGGNGFLGSNLVEYLLDKGHNILVLSRKYNNIEHLLDKIEFIQYNSNDYYTYQNKILNFSPDIVIHCAWEGGNSYIDINSSDQIHKNISLSLSLLEITNKQLNKPKFIGFGTFVEYGIIDKKAKENQIENPINFYGLAKNIFKNISKLYCNQNNIEWVWIRPCYVYGSKDVPTRLIPSIINKLLKNESIILNSCDTVIDYLHIDDFCSALSSLITTNNKGVFNICSGKEYSLRNIIDFIQQNILTSQKIVFDPSLDRKFSSKYICGSNNKLIKHTNWHPLISINEGIIKTINYQKSKI